MPKLKVLKAQNPADTGRLSADVVSELMHAQPNCLLGLATGSTPLPLYRELVLRYQQGSLDFSKVRSVNLDEYVGLPADDPQSYRYFMQKNLFQHINMDPRNARIPDGMAPDLTAECDQYEAQIAAWDGVDLQVLGIGLNGHIGFNEPAPIFTCRTHVTNLTESTRQANQRFFPDSEHVPHQAITMGIGTIMDARKILLICAGTKKAEILEKAFFSPVDPMVPASVLQFHQNVTVVADEGALAIIHRKHPDVLTG